MLVLCSKLTAAVTDADCSVPAVSRTKCAQREGWLVVGCVRAYSRLATAVRSDHEWSAQLASVDVHVQILLLLIVGPKLNKAEGSRHSVLKAKALKKFTPVLDFSLSQFFSSKIFHGCCYPEALSHQVN